jgi:hypothetical protein
LLLAFGATEYFYWPWGLFASNFISTLMLISISLVQILAFSVPLLKPKTSGSTPNGSAKLESAPSKTTLSAPSTQLSPRTEDALLPSALSQRDLSRINDTVIPMEQQRNNNSNNTSHDHESYDSEISDSSYDSNIDTNKIRETITSDEQERVTSYISTEDDSRESYPSTKRSVEVI